MLSCPATPAGDRADRYRLPPLLALRRDYRGRRAMPGEARKVADLAACEAWNIRMKGHGGPAAIAIARRRPQRRLSLSESEVRWLQKK